MKRIISVLAAMAAMVVMAVPAFAAPLEPGPNSFNAGQPPQGEINYGHCQGKQVAKWPGSANIAKEYNPALYFPNTSGAVGVGCLKDFEI